MGSATPQIHIDGKWIRCLLAEEYGFLGSRLLCDLGKTPGQSRKKLLIRHRTWPQAGVSSDRPPAELLVNAFPDRDKLGLRPVAIKKYHQAVAQAGGKPRAESCEVFQHDITGLVSLKGAVLRAVKEGEPQRIWRLFYNTCKALDEFGKAAAGHDGQVPLQCPSSLAVGTDGRVIPLDAEIIPAGPIADCPEAAHAYHNWFGTVGASGVASVREASPLHVKALLLYFGHLLDSLRQQTDADGQARLAQIILQLEQVRPGQSLTDLEDWIRQNSEDWGIVLDGDQDVDLIPVHADEVVNGGPKKRSLLLRLSLWLNVLLAVAVLVLYLMRPTGNRTNAETTEVYLPGDSTLLFSSNCVVFPTQGTLGDKVNAALQDLFPGNVQEPLRGGVQHDRLLRDKMDATLKSVQETDKLKELLVQLADKHSIRFKGFVPNEAEGSIKAIIERGGVFTVSTLAGQQHGSLLQAGGLDKVLHQAGLQDKQQPRALLASLRTAIAEYASLKDALSIIGERNAYILRVEPTAAAHEQMRRKLLSRLEKPVFISRPVLELFDAVDPTADTGGGSAFYTLQLDRKCFWRLASLEDRRKVDYASNTSNDRMKWQSFKPGQRIEWKPIPVRKKNGRTDPVSSFDIAVILENKVVVFRNQSLMVGESRKQIVEQGENYLRRVLRLDMPATEDAISVRQIGEQYTGTLIYSYVAEQITADNSGRDREVQVLNPAGFQTLKDQENSF